MNLGNLGSELRDHDEHNVDTPGTLGLAVACILELLDDWSGVEGPGVCLELDAHLVVHPALPGLLGAGGAVHAHKRRDIVVPHHGMVQPGGGRGEARGVGGRWEKKEQKIAIIEVVCSLFFLFSKIKPTCVITENIFLMK